METRGPGPTARFLVVLTMSLALVRCGSVDDPPQSARSSSVPQTTPAPSQPPPSPVPPTVGQPAVLPGGPKAVPAPIPAPPPASGVVTAARRDLAGRKGVAEVDISLVSVEDVTWRDSALGCPSTDVRYEPGAVAGYRIVLQAQTVTYTYHGAHGGRGPFLCQFLD